MVFGSLINGIRWTAQERVSSITLRYLICYHRANISTCISVYGYILSSNNGHSFIVYLQVVFNDIKCHQLLGTSHMLKPLITSRSGLWRNLQSRSLDAILELEETNRGIYLGTC